MTWPKRIVVALVALAFLGVLAGVGGIVGVFWWFGRGVAELDEASLKNYRPPQVTRIYARDGTLIGEVYEQRRTLIRYEEIPSHVENAFLAAEDADFYQHEGMDYMGMARALLVNVRARRVKQGASTITQQVVKNFILNPERTLERKVQELILARRLEQALTKQQILELYLNEIYFGHGRYGLDEAAWYYFGKSVRDIDLGQGALLATLPKAPSRDSPYKNRERAKERQVWVLQQMVKHGFATAEDAQPFIDAPLSVVDAQGRPAVDHSADEFVDEVHRRLTAEYGDALPTLGARVTTTVDLAVQAQAREGLITSLHELDERQGYGAFARPGTKKKLRAARKDAASIGDGWTSQSSN
ncbi:MAG: transglycosylase domain-containing protein [Myxococcota bacterium]